MKINAPLALFLVLFTSVISLQGQAPTGGWGNCEFATVASMNGFDPSGSTYTCKKAYVTATDEHYRWDGSAWILESDDDENIYNTSDTLTADRTVTHDNFTLDFDLNGTGDFRILDNSSEVFKVTDGGRIGLWNPNPFYPLHAINSLDVNPFYFYSGNGLTGEKDIFTIQDADAGGGGQDRSSVLKLWKSANINTSDFGFSLAELTYTGSDPGDGKHWISGRRFDEGAVEWGVNISDNQIWSSGGILLNATGDAAGTYSGGDFIVEADGDVGIGTTTPDAKLDIENGGLRLSDYGDGGAYLDTASAATPADIAYVLGVDSNGDVLEMNTAKSSKVFYPPAIAIDASTTGTGFTLDLHATYQAYFGAPPIRSSGAPVSIPTYSETELFYYITDYDNTVFSGIQIDAGGLMTYNVIDVPSDSNCSMMNIVFVVK